jgi:hypothetical protein
MKYERVDGVSSYPSLCCKHILLKVATEQLFAILDFLINTVQFFTVKFVYQSWPAVLIGIV